ncbi:MAG TPA: TIGR02611 family protein [Pilimelia sp.]|nr:TIGR02611 family protein [Pilimelia sp.]
MRDGLAVVRANPTGRIALKAGVALLGGLVVAVGIVLIPLPGPGWALVILGLAIWAVEFVWAKHLLRFTRTQVRRWTDWVRRQSLLVRFLIGLLGLAFIGSVLLISVRYSLKVDLLHELWEFLEAY